jgi:hypothetical protein
VKASDASSQNVWIIDVKQNPHKVRPLGQEEIKDIVNNRGSVDG